MITLKNNNTKMLSSSFTTLSNLRNGNSKVLNDKINSLTDPILSSSSLTSKTNEISLISNNKSTIKNLKDENQKLNYASLSNLLTSNNKQHLPSNYKLDTKYLDAKGKFIGIGKKNMPFDSFKLTIMNNSNKLRHYINSISDFKFTLANSTYNFYSFNQTKKYLFAMKAASNLLTTSFNNKGCLISKPSFSVTHTNYRLEDEIKNSFRKGYNLNPAKITINLFYFVKTANLQDKSNLDLSLLNDTFDSKFSNLTDCLTKLFNTEVELNLTRLYQPYHESNILVQFLNSESYNNKFIRLVSQLFQHANIYKVNKLSSLITPDNKLSNQTNVAFPSGISGINVKLAGRSLNERIIPRLTVKRAQRGTFNRLNSKLINKSVFTDKTKKGAFSFTVTLSQTFR